MDSNYSKGQIMKCPGCENKFSFTRCVECKKLIFYKGNSSILGKSIKCNCGQISVNIICPSCNVRISFSDRDNDIEIGEKINCPNCNQNFEYKENNEENIYYKNLSIINILEGNKIDFGKPQIDENYLETQKILVNFKLYNYNNSSNITENDTECTISKEEDNITKLLKKEYVYYANIMIKKVYFILVDIDVHVINVLFIIMKYSKNVQDVDKNQKVLYLKYIISNCIIFDKAILYFLLYIKFNYN